MSYEYLNYDHNQCGPIRYPEFHHGLLSWWSLGPHTFRSELNPEETLRQVRPQDLVKDTK